MVSAVTSFVTMRPGWARDPAGGKIAKMGRRRGLAAFVAASVVMVHVLTVAPRAASAALAAFPDVSGHWSRAAVQKMALKGVLSGYDDGTFRPDRPVSRLEITIALVRVLGLEATARSAADSSYAGTPYAWLPAWARGYAAVAVARGIIDEKLVRGGTLQQDARRHELAEMAVRALDLTERAQSRQGALPEFLDALEIPFEARGFVSVAVERKLMQGDSGLFRPLAGVTRAELAVILDRVDRRISNAIDEQEVLGEIAAVEAADSSAPAVAGKLTITKASGGSTTLDVPAGAVVYRGGQEASASALKPFDEVVVLKNPAGDVVFVAADPPPFETYRGKVVRVIPATSDADASLRLEVDGQERAYAVADDARVRRDGSTVRLSELLPGDDARIQLDGGKVIRVEAVTVTRRVSGTLSSLTLSATPSIAVTTDDGKEETFAIAERTVIRRDGATLALTDLGLGHYLTVSASGNLATRIEVESRDAFQELAGVIVSIDYENRRLVIALTQRPVASDADPTRSVRVSSAAIVVRHAELAEFRDLRVGDRVMMAGWSRLSLFDANTVVVTYTTH